MNGRERERDKQNIRTCHSRIGIELKRSLSVRLNRIYSVTNCLIISFDSSLRLWEKVENYGKSVGRQNLLQWESVAHFGLTCYMYTVG